MKLQYIKASAIKAEAKANGKRVSKDFIEALDRLVGRKMQVALAEHNGGRKTMDACLAGFILGYIEKKERQ